MHLLSLLGVLRTFGPTPQARPQSAPESIPAGADGALRFLETPSPQQLEVDVKNVVTDSRELAQGSVFVALRGTQRDGHEFIPQALAAGVAGIVAEEKALQALIDAGKIPELSKTNRIQGPQPPIVLVEDSRAALDLLARRLFYDPSHRLLCFGVTGTNGKTSTVYLLEHLMNAASVPTGVLGTIDHHLGTDVWPSTHTTPDPVRLQGRLAEMKSLGAQAIAMEVSSHALDQRRADGIQFNTVIFTNLTRDHLDYHKTESLYFAAKQRLFSDLLWNSGKVPLFAIVNIDDPWGRKLRVSSQAGLWTFGESSAADFRFQIESQDFSGMKFNLRSPFGDFTGQVPMIGRHNLYNAVGAVAAVASVGVGPAVSLRHLQDFPGVPGRLQRVADARGRFVFVDYAHTPDALENVLGTLTQIRSQLAGKKPRLLTLFGCGGDRDKGKRPLMAQIAARFSDQVVVTSDNPRSEDPHSILSEIEKGFAVEDRGKVRLQVDRAAAIREILLAAETGDVVLIAGKGHELYQEIGGEKREFSDVAEAEKVLRQL